MKFNSNPSPLFNEAVEILKKLHDEEGNQDRAYAQAMAEVYEAMFRTNRNVDRFLAVHDPSSIVPSERDFCVKRQWVDHSELWMREDERAVFVSHPYQITTEGLMDLAQFCSVNRCQVNIHSRSHYFPTRTIAVEILPPRKI